MNKILMASDSNGDGMMAAIDEIKKELEVCPGCGSPEAKLSLYFLQYPAEWQYICTNCNYEGPITQTRGGARIAWNKQSKREIDRR